VRHPQVLVVDDDRLFCESLVDHFASHGLSAAYVTSLHAAAAQRLDHFAVIVLDNHLPDGDGLTLIDAVVREGPGPSFIVVTGDPTYEHAVAAMRRRVVDYLSKPVALDALTGAVTRVFAGLPLPPSADASAPTEALPDEIARYARSEVPILVTGETGTGKSRLAHRIHLVSPRAAGPFVAINCATLAESIVEAELFGVCRGAFTGAGDRPGLLALGHGGTLLLDEVGELPLPMQAKLLSVLEDRRVRRVGGSRWKDLDVRIVAATHVDLAAAVEAGRFRADLMFRLDVGRVTLPPLRELPPRALSEAVARLLDELRAPRARLEADELERLAAYEWPGNYRELRNALARALVLHPAHALRPSACLPRAVSPRTPGGDRPDRAAAASEPRTLTLAELELRHVLATLTRCEGHRGRTAKALGISEVTLRRKLAAWRRDGTDHFVRIEHLDRSK
jgi:DNA-binding NtrC family response regulator